MLFFFVCHAAPMPSAVATNLHISSLQQPERGWRGSAPCSLAGNKQYFLQKRALLLSHPVRCRQEVFHKTTRWQEHPEPQQLHRPSWDGAPAARCFAMAAWCRRVSRVQESSTVQSSWVLTAWWLYTEGCCLSSIPQPPSPERDETPCVL